MNAHDETIEAFFLGIAEGKDDIRESLILKFNEKYITKKAKSYNTVKGKNIDDSAFIDGVKWVLKNI